MRFAVFALALLPAREAAHVFDLKTQLKTGPSANDLFCERALAFAMDPGAPTAADMQALEDQFLVTLRDKMQPKSAGGGPCDPEIIDNVNKTAEKIKENVNDSHIHAELEIEELIDSISECLNTIYTWGNQTPNRNRTMEDLAKNHTDCREKESFESDEDKDCNDGLDEENRAGSTICDDIKDKLPNKDWCKPAEFDEEYDRYLDRLIPVFENAIAEFEEENTRCKTSHDLLDKQAKTCQEHDKKLEALKEECDEKQRELELTVCTNEVKRRDICENKAACWMNAVVKYKNQSKIIQKHAESRKAQWVSAERIQCLLTTLKTEDKGAAIQKCVETSHNVSHLELTFPEVPEEGKCPAAEPLPCTEPFQGKWYKNTMEKELAACTDCQELLSPVPDVPPLIDEAMPLMGGDPASLPPEPAGLF